MTNSFTAETSLIFSELAYDINGNLTNGVPEGSIPEGYEVVTNLFKGNGFIDDNETGLRVIVLKNDNNEFIISFAGTDSVQDVYQDINLGWGQWDRAKEEFDFINILKQIDNDATKIHFTGHSLKKGSSIILTVSWVLTILPHYASPVTDRIRECLLPCDEPWQRPTTHIPW